MCARLNTVLLITRRRHLGNLICEPNDRTARGLDCSGFGISAHVIRYRLNHRIIDAAGFIELTAKGDQFSVVFLHDALMAIRCVKRNSHD